MLIFMAIYIRSSLRTHKNTELGLLHHQTLTILDLDVDMALLLPTCWWNSSRLQKIIMNTDLFLWVKFWARHFYNNSINSWIKIIPSKPEPRFRHACQMVLYDTPSMVFIHVNLPSSRMKHSRGKKRKLIRWSLQQNSLEGKCESRTKTLGSATVISLHGKHFAGVIKFRILR